MQAQLTASIPLEADRLDQRDGSGLAEALKCLITELIGWGVPADVDSGFAITANE